MRNLKIRLAGADMVAPALPPWAGEQPTREWEAPTDALPGTLISVFNTSSPAPATKS